MSNTDWPGFAILTISSSSFHLVSFTKTLTSNIANICHIVIYCWDWVQDWYDHLTKNDVRINSVSLAYYERVHICFTLQAQLYNSVQKC